MHIRFEPITAQHLPMLRDWLNKPHWRKWWGDPKTELSYISDMIEGRDTSRPFIFHVNDEPMGYIQYWFIGHHQNAEWIPDNPWLADLPANAIGVDLSIAHPEKLSKGIGSQVLRTFAEGLVAEGRQTIIIDPDPENTRAVRAYEKAGFRTMPELLEKASDCVIMRYQPKINERD